jgi:hypothetical protein
MKAGEGPWAVLTDITLRVETLVCNEAVSERTNRTMRRLFPSTVIMDHGRNKKSICIVCVSHMIFPGRHERIRFSKAAKALWHYH